MRNVIHAANITTYLDFAAYLNNDQHYILWGENYDFLKKPTKSVTKLSLKNNSVVHSWSNEF